MIKIVNANPISNDSNAIKMIKISRNRDTVSMDVNPGLTKNINPVTTAPMMIMIKITIPTMVSRFLRSSCGFDRIGASCGSLIPVSI